MNYFVPDFIINPVLRQARRFSRSSFTSERIDTAPIEEWSSAAGPSPEDGTESSSSVPLRGVTLHSSEVTIDDPSLLASSTFQSALIDTSAPDNTSYYRNIGSLEGSAVQPQDQSQTTGSSAGNQQQENSLPEDDGMGQLRQRIVAIQKMDIASGEKARLMHQLLTEKYRLSQLSQQAKFMQRGRSPIRTVSQERPTTPIPLSAFSFWQKSMTDTPQNSSPRGIHQTLQLSQDDLRPTYVPIDDHLVKSNSEEGEEAEQTRLLGCQHYVRNVKLQCFTCNRWYTCRFCHDDVEDHHLNRRETRNMLCMLCGCAQKAGDTCVYCGVRAAWYYCNICHLWDDDMNKSIYHCNDCGICRKGRGIGKDYVHCKVSHNCRLLEIKLIYSIDLWSLCSHCQGAFTQMY